MPRAHEYFDTASVVEFFEYMSNKGSNILDNKNDKN